MIHSQGARSGMGAKDDKGERMVELPLDRFDRLLVLLERLAQAQERNLGQQQDTARRAARKAGATTDAAMDRVEKRLKKLNGG